MPILRAGGDCSYVSGRVLVCPVVSVVPDSTVFRISLFRYGWSESIASGVGGGIAFPQKTCVNVLMCQFLYIGLYIYLLRKRNICSCWGRPTPHFQHHTLFEEVSTSHRDSITYFTSIVFNLDKSQKLGMGKIGTRAAIHRDHVQRGRHAMGRTAMTGSRGGRVRGTFAISLDHVQRGTRAGDAFDFLILSGGKGYLRMACMRTSRLAKQYLEKPKNGGSRSKKFFWRG